MTVAELRAALAEWGDDEQILVATENHLERLLSVDHGDLGVVLEGDMEENLAWRDR